MNCKLVTFGAVHKLADIYEEFCVNVYENFYAICAFAEKVLKVFGSTYICEQTLSVMNFSKKEVTGVLISP